MDDSLKFEKERAIARFNRVRAAMRLLQFVKIAIIVAAICWCAPALFRWTVALLVSLSTYACNHHVVFFVGNAIIVSLFMLCRQSATSASAAVDRRGNVYDDYVKYSEVARGTPSPPLAEVEDVATPAAEFGFEFDGDKQIIDEETAAIFAKCDEVGRVIEEETRKIRWFERTQSESLRRELAAKRELRRSETEARRENVSSEAAGIDNLMSSTEEFQRTQSESLRRELAARRELRRSETEARRETVSSEATDIDNLSSEEFRRRVDAFIEQHRRRRAAKLEENEIVDSD